MNISSKKWQIRTIFASQVEILEISTGKFKSVERTVLPNDHQLAMMSEYRFNMWCSEVFYGE